MADGGDESGSDTIHKVSSRRAYARNLQNPPRSRHHCRTDASISPRATSDRTYMVSPQGDLLAPIRRVGRCTVSGALLPRFDGFIPYCNSGALRQGSRENGCAAGSPYRRWRYGYTSARSNRPRSAHDYNPLYTVLGRRVPIFCTSCVPIYAGDYSGQSAPCHPPQKATPYLMRLTRTTGMCGDLIP